MRTALTCSRLIETPTHNKDNCPEISAAFLHSCHLAKTFPKSIGAFFRTETIITTDPHNEFETLNGRLRHDNPSTQDEHLFSTIESKRWSNGFSR